MLALKFNKETGAYDASRKPRIPIYEKNINQKPTEIFLMITTVRRCRKTITLFTCGRQGQYFLGETVGGLLLIMQGLSMEYNLPSSHRIPLGATLASLPLMHSPNCPWPSQTVSCSDCCKSGFLLVCSLARSRLLLPRPVISC